MPKRTPDVLVLSVRQPLAWLIVAGHKTIENRRWTTRHRGRILIHAGSAAHPADDEIRAFARRRRIQIPDDLPRGAIVGSVELIDVVDDESGLSRRDRAWFDGRFGFVLRNPRALKRPIPAAGWLRLYRYVRPRRRRRVG